MGEVREGSVHQQRENPYKQLKVYAIPVRDIAEFAQPDAVFIFSADAFIIPRPDESRSHHAERVRACISDAKLVYTVDNPGTFDPENTTREPRDVLVRGVKKVHNHLVPKGGHAARILSIDVVMRAISQGRVLRISPDILRDRGYILDAITAPVIHIPDDAPPNPPPLHSRRNGHNTP